MTTSGVIQWQLWRSFHKTSSKIVLKGGLGADIGAYLPKGSTLKATTVVFSNEVCSAFTVMSSQTLLSDHILLTHSNTNVLRKKWFQDRFITLKSIQSICMIYHSIDRFFSFQTVWHVMPSTDRKLELTAKASMAQPVSQMTVCCSGLKEFLTLKNMLY